jgi:hypothetical protein
MCSSGYLGLTRLDNDIISLHYNDTLRELKKTIDKVLEKYSYQYSYRMQIENTQNNKT